MTLVKDYDLFVGDRDLAEEVRRIVRRLPGKIKKHLNVYSEWERFHPLPSRVVYLIFNIWELADPRHLERIHSIDSRWRRFLLFSGGLRPQSIGQYLIKLSGRADERLHLADPVREGREAYLGRFFNALFAPPAARAILDAWREANLFMVKAPDYKLLRVPIAELPRLAQAEPGEIENFMIGECGAYIDWPGLDLRLGWNDFEQLADPRARLKAEQQSPDYVVRYGQAIRDLRERAGLEREAIAGMNPRTIRRIENGETRTTANALRKLAAAHHLSEEEYIARVTELMVKPGRN